MGDNMSPADLKAVLGNGTTTVAYPYMNGNGFGGFGNGDWSWILLLILLTGGYGFGGGFGGFGMGMDFMYPWLANGQQEIMSNTNNGFDNLHLSNQIEGVRDGINDIQNAICNSTASINSNVSNGFYNAEIGANNRQMANMQQAFNNQLSTIQGFNGVNSALCDASAENRLGQANLTSTILSENCADRALLQEGIRDVITASQNNTQRIIDEIFRDRLDEKDSKISDLQRQLQTAEQNAFIASNLNNEIDLMYNRLVNCPIPSTPVYGRTPIFTCNGGCGCGNFNGSI